MLPRTRTVLLFGTTTTALFSMDGLPIQGSSSEGHHIWQVHRIWTKTVRVNVEVIVGANVTVGFDSMPSFVFEEIGHESKQAESSAAVLVHELYARKHKKSKVRPVRHIWRPSKSLHCIYTCDPTVLDSEGPSTANEVSFFFFPPLNLRWS